MVCTNLRGVFSQVICKNGDEVFASSEMLSLSAASLSAVLLCDDLQVEDETVVFAAVEGWARAQVTTNCDESDEPTEAG